MQSNRPAVRCIERPTLMPTFLRVSCLLTSMILCSAGFGADEPVKREIPQSPVPAEETLELFELHPDCRIELVAAEPDVIDPVHIAFDVRGRMWVVEYTDYPNGPAEGEPGLSRIRVLTDDDGDGRFENAQIFADKLLFANGLMLFRDGVIVTTDGSVVFMRDADGDGRVDEKLLLFTGFKKENPQLRANHPTFALDNHIYVANGLRGGEVIAGDGWAEFFDQPAETKHEPVSLSGRDFRFDPRSGEYEAISGVGQFGVTFDDWGNRFVCSNRNPCDHVVLEERYLRRNPDVAVSRVVEVVSPAGVDSAIFPISRFWTTSNLHAGQFTAACGVCINRGTALPPAMHGNSFTCDPTGNLVHRDVLKPHGATFSAEYGREGIEFLATTDEWCRPVNLTIGPDGALYVVDMHRAVIEHPQFMPEELKNRPDLTFGTDRGRIYRIVAKDHESNFTATAPADAEPPDLFAMLDHENSWQRDAAHRLLFERGDSSDETKQQLNAVFVTGSPQSRVHALWLLDGLGILDRDVLAKALDDPHPRVVENAVRLAELSFPEDAEFGERVLEVAESTDDLRLKFQCILSLTGFFPTSDSYDMFAQATLNPESGFWMRTAVALATESPGDVLETVLQQLNVQAVSDEARITEIVEEFAVLTGAKNDDSVVEQVLASLSGQSAAVRSACLAGLGQGMRRRGAQLTQIADPSLFELPSEQLRHHEKYEDPADRILAARALEFAPARFAASLYEAGLDDPDQSVQLAVIDVLSRRGDEAIGPVLVERLGTATPTIRQAMISAMLANSSRTRLLLNEIEAGNISPREIDPPQANRLRNHGDEEIRGLAQKLLVVQTAADREEVIARYRDALTIESDPNRGRTVFIKNCQQCHKVGDVGVDVAPDISDSRTKTAEQLLVSILDPNRAIDNNYFSFSIVDLDGVVHTGVISAETATTVTLKQPEGKQVTILRSDIDELKSNGVSLMPVGLEQKLTVEEMADLISFIKNWRYLDGVVPKEVIR
ncbi:MAG: hypothetical protein DWQ41_19585 [Planctomycetota bacterium]|nr:MAG: hypothetical protein DWQ41_19585 [Planctomycetota bacterium]